MANYPQELAQDTVCQSHTGHMTGLWFLPTRPLRLNTNEWMILCLNIIKTVTVNRRPLDSYDIFLCKIFVWTCVKMASVQAEMCSTHVKVTFWIAILLCCVILNNFDVLLAVHLSIILVINQLNAQNLVLQVYYTPLHVSSTIVLIIRRSKLYYTASGIIATILTWRIINLL